MSAIWLGMMLAALVLLLAAIWLGTLFFWANQHGPEQRALYHSMVRTHGLDHPDRREVEAAMARGVAVEGPRLRVAAVDWASRALARDRGLRAAHPRGCAAVVGCYVLAAACLTAAVVLLVLDGHTRRSPAVIVTLDTASMVLLAGRPFLRRRNWQRAIDRNSAGAPAPSE